MRACCWYFFAVHSDRHTMRNGISLVINTASTSKKKIGNEKKLQVAWQNFPTRAQGIYILGVSMIARVAINALIAFAALFAKNKVIAYAALSQTLSAASAPLLQRLLSWASARLTVAPGVSSLLRYQAWRPRLARPTSLRPMAATSGHQLASGLMSAWQTSQRWACPRTCEVAGRGDKGRGGFLFVLSKPWGGSPCCASCLCTLGSMPMCRTAPRYGYGHGYKLGLHRSPTSLPLV